MNAPRTARLRKFVKQLSNIRRVTMHDLDQLEWFRRLVGGIWVKSNGYWKEVFVDQFLVDGTRIFVEDIPSENSKSHYHESHLSIQEIQEFV